VRVALRLRPLMPHETQRNDKSIATVPDTTHVHLSLKTGAKQYRFNAVLPDSTTQMDVFSKCGVNELIDSALEGYATTILAYGQTGSGKTYTMMGKENLLARDGWMPDSNDGLFL
jgi:predicted metalloprotease with PDZ domain